MAVSPLAGFNNLSIPSSKQQSKFAGQSVRAIPIRVLTVGKKRSQGVQLIVDEYMKKLKHYCSVEDVRIKSNPRNARDVVAQIEHEDMAVMGHIRPDEWVVMLDERGHDVGSEQMASLIGDAGNKGASSLLFCIGGPYGHGRQLRQRANISVKLSSLVLNHEIAVVVLIEQLYRNLRYIALNILTERGPFLKDRITITRHWCLNYDKATEVQILDVPNHPPEEEEMVEK